MQIAAQYWLVRDLHAEPYYLGLLSLAGALPMLLETPIGGAVADRVPRLTLVRLTQVGLLVQASLLAVLTMGGWVQFWHLAALTFFGSLVLALDNPGRQSLLPDLVPPEHLASAVSLNSVVWSGAALFGPALAGLLLEPIGAGGLFALNAATFLAVIYALSTLRGVPQRAGGQGSLRAGLLAGVRYAAGDPLVRTVLLLLTATSLLGRSYQALMPVFARDLLEVGAQGYGLMLAAPGAGAILGGLGLAALRTTGRQAVIALAALFGFAAALLGFSLSRAFPASLLLLLVVGLSSTVLTASCATLLQLHAPRALRGRVMSLAAVSNIGMTQLGGLLSGLAATLLTAPLAVASGAVLLATFGAVLSLRHGWRSRS